MRRILGIVLCSLMLAGCGQQPEGPGVAVSSSAPRPYDEAATRGGDAAPHQAENRGPLQRGDVPAEFTGTAEEAARRIEAALRPLHEAGDYLPDAVRAAIIAAGFPAEKVSTLGMTPPLSGYDAPPIGTAFGVSVAPRTCVTGAIAADRLRAEVAGSSVEWGCLEPKTH